MSHHLVRTAASALALCALLAARAASVNAATLELTVAEHGVTAPDNNRVSLLRVFESDGADGPLDRSSFLQVAKTDQGNPYTLALRSIEPPGDKQRFFTFEFVVISDDQTVPPVVVSYNVSTTGRFADFFQEVPFKVNKDGKESRGRIMLFFPSVEPAQVCEPVDLPSREKPKQVWSSGNTPIKVTVDCAAAAAPPRAVSLSGLEGNGDYWAKRDIASRYVGPNARPIDQKRFELLSASVSPNVWQTVGARFRRDGPDDTLVVDFEYMVPPYGLQRTLKVEIPIVFYPFISVIAGGLLAGVFLGWFGGLLLTFVANMRKPWTHVFASFWLGLVLSVLFYLIALLTWATNSRLTLFNFELNPSDVVLVFLIGVAAGCLAL
ncbi:MAG TPA: hypothetical protein VFD69_22170, partial [Vicinamibacterales bacterium]|nr:hypothetical protein [Vicinamibacterales bacterium]